MPDVPVCWSFAALDPGSWASFFEKEWLKLELKLVGVKRARNLNAGTTKLLISKCQCCDTCWVHIKRLDQVREVRGRIFEEVKIWTKDLKDEWDLTRLRRKSEGNKYACAQTLAWWVWRTKIGLMWLEQKRGGKCRYQWGQTRCSESASFLGWRRSFGKNFIVLSGGDARKADLNFQKDTGWLLVR